MDERSKAELKKNYSDVDKGYNSFPTCIPGTPYQKAIQVSKNAVHVVLLFVDLQPVVLLDPGKETTG